MISRREYLKLCLAAGAAITLNPSLLWSRGDDRLGLIRRTIPSTGESIPAIGLGSSATFAELADAGQADAVGAVLQAMVDHGGAVFDTAPSYAGGVSEAVAGEQARALGITDRLFWATKLNVAGRDGGDADPAAARTQLEESFARVDKDVIELIQVHNMGDIPTQLPLLKEYKEEGRVRHIGVTTTFPEQYDHLEQVMEREPLDFIGIDYAIDNRTMEERILPLAEDRGMAVLVYAPFGRTRLWQRVRDHAVPDWAAEFDAHSWAQFFLKFVLSHPVVTAATPATSRPHHMVDNMGAALGALPDAEMRKRMIAHVAEL